MLGIPNPYVIVGAVLLSVAALGGSYIAGRTDGAHIEQAAQAKADRAAEKARDELQGQIAASNQAHQTKENDRQTSVREINHEKETIVERPVYLNQCVDRDGVRLLQRAADNANGKLEPAGAAAGATGAAADR